MKSSGWKPTHLTSAFSQWTSIFTSPHGTMLMAFVDVKYGCLWMLDGSVSTHPMKSGFFAKRQWWKSLIRLSPVARRTCRSPSRTWSRREPGTWWTEPGVNQIKLSFFGAVITDRPNNDRQDFWSIDNLPTCVKSVLLTDMDNWSTGVEFLVIWTTNWLTNDRP